MSDVLVVCVITGVVFILFAAIRYLRAGKRHDDTVSQSWRREQAKKDRDDDTKTWPLPPAEV